MKRSIAKGTPEQFLNRVQNRIAELGGDVEACDAIVSSQEVEESDLLSAFDNCDYEVIDAGYSDDGSIIVSLNYNVYDIDEVAEHLAYCLSDCGVEVADWNTNGSNVFVFTPRDDSEPITAASETTYVDDNGVMGEIGDTWTVSELRQYWDAEQMNDPVLSDYDSFESWLEDTTSQMTEMDFTSDYDKYCKDWIAQIKNKLASVGVDVNSPEAEEYAEAVAELVAGDDNHDVDYWWQETQADPTFMDEVDALPHIDASTNIMSGRDNDNTYDDRFIHTLMGDIESEVSREVDGLTFDTLENALNVTVVHGGEVTQFTVPHEDLSFDFDTMSDDVAYVVDTIRESLDLFSSADNVADSGTELNVSSATNTCGIACKPEVLSSVAGDVIHGLTWSGLIQELSERGYEVDASYRRSPDEHIVAYKDGKSYDIEVTQYSEGDYEIVLDNISEIIEADIDVYENDDINDEDGSKQYLEIESKQVLDSDGFYTDYTMYFDSNTGEYVFVFGDKDIYSPADGNFDWQCETEEEAWEWFNSYEGFVDIDETTDIDNDYTDVDSLDSNTKQNLLAKARKICSFTTGDNWFDITNKQRVLLNIRIANDMDDYSNIEQKASEIFGEPIINIWWDDYVLVIDVTDWFANNVLESLDNYDEDPEDEFEK